MMPKVDGWAVLQQLKADPQLQDIPVIMVSMIGDKEMGYTLGATEYLTKPVDRRRLSQLLRRYRCESPPCPLLLVEDDEGVREMMRRDLTKEGWSVTEAANGKEALARVEENAPALILLDLMMPVMDGFEFVMELRKVPAWRAIPIIVVTAKDLSEEDRRRLRDNVEQIIEKGGLSSEDLLQQVRDGIGCDPSE